MHEFAIRNSIQTSTTFTPLLPLLDTKVVEGGDSKGVEVEVGNSAAGRTLGKGGRDAREFAN